MKLEKVKRAEVLLVLRAVDECGPGAKASDLLVKVNDEFKHRMSYATLENCLYRLTAQPNSHVETKTATNTDVSMRRAEYSITLVGKDALRDG